MTSAGIVSSGGPGRWWAWTALRVAPSNGAPRHAHQLPVRPDASVHNNFGGAAQNVVQAGTVIGGVHIHHDPHQSIPDDRPWLMALWALAESAHAVVELRYIRGLESDGLAAYLIIRVERADEPDAVAAAGRLRAELLGAMPAYVAAQPIIADDELLGILTPLRPDPDGLVEIRKPLAAAPTRRAGRNRPWLAAVTPWRRADRPWGPLCEELAGLPFRATLSVGLAPYRIGPGLRKLLADQAGLLATLAGPGPSLTYSVFGEPQAADQFAVHAHPLLTEAVGRYTEIAFQARVSLAAEASLPARLAELVANAISPAVPGGGMAGAGGVSVRPSSHELDTAWRNVTALNFDPLPTAHLQGCAPEAIGDLERTLGAIVDVDEAAAAFRLPYQESVFRPLAVQRVN